MAVLTEAKQRPVRLAHGELTTRVWGMAGYTNYAGGSANNYIYKGGIVACDVSDTDGYVHSPVATGTTAAATGDFFAGIAAETQKVDSSITGDGDKKVTVYTNGVWGFAKGSLAITDVGADAYASDDNTITTTSTDNWLVGKIVDVDDTYVWVDITVYMNTPLS